MMTFVIGGRAINGVSGSLFFSCSTNSHSVAHIQSVSTDLHSHSIKAHATPSDFVKSFDWQSSEGHYTGVSSPNEDLPWDEGFIRHVDVSFVLCPVSRRYEQLQVLAKYDHENWDITQQEVLDHQSQGRAWDLYELLYEAYCSTRDWGLDVNFLLNVYYGALEQDVDLAL